MATIILVAHGSQRSGSFSNSKVKIITKAGTALSFQEAKDYMNGSAFPEYTSSSLGDFGGLSDTDCTALFGSVPGAGSGYINTGKRKGGDMMGYQIFALRGQNVSFAEIGIFAQNYEKVILLACRT
ncbi:hypothetical protein NIES2107_16490 [Nostoc carneum NIES-2107]|nr:hypothetical protein NIES2107_16490 [Nostoc carneum NIES-2107]